jgi:hypothetical protein
MNNQLMLLSWGAPLVLATSVLGSAPASRPAQTSPVATPSSLWENPRDLPDRELYYGPWGREGAPDSEALYTFLHPKRGGVNPGVVVKDPAGRQWHVKQAPQGSASGRGDEGPVEVVLSRVLSAVGYHQPAVYYLPSFTMQDARGIRVQRGGRFRLSDDRLKDLGEWSWQQNPFVGTQPFQGLLAILLIFNSGDLKNSNNTLYELRDGATTERRYVVRDLGSALGQTGRFWPKRNNLTVFEHEPLVTGVRKGFVTFNYRGLHKELVVNRITPPDLAWASALLERLSDRQWQDAFRAGGYPRAVADGFIGALHSRIAEGLRLHVEISPAAPAAPGAEAPR